MKVYLKGHGYLWTANVYIRLLADFVTYVDEGNMLDGMGIANLIDKGVFGWQPKVAEKVNERAPSAKDRAKALQAMMGKANPATVDPLKLEKPKEVPKPKPVLEGGIEQGSTYKLDTKKKGEMLQQHFLITDPASTRDDLAQATIRAGGSNQRCDKFCKADKTHRVYFGDADGTNGNMLKLNDHEFIYFTADNCMTPFSVIQGYVHDCFAASHYARDYEFHWIACRQKIGGDTYLEAFNLVREAANGQFGVTSFIEDLRAQPALQKRA
jgi:hypothetical protein